MISLCTDYNLILSAINNQVASGYIEEHIRLYLESYGTDYDFQEIFLQKETETDEIAAIILRYNNQIFVSTSNNADLAELHIFLSGFAESIVIVDKSLKAYFPASETCFIMNKIGENSEEISCVSLSDNHKEIAALVGESLSQSEKLDYYLNLSHQMRHDKIRAYAYYIDKKPVAVVIMSTTAPKLHIITTVYTQEHFRGNGYAKQILDKICCDDSKKYVLICEEHNIKFYEKCGFSVVDTCIRFRL